ncbi:MAG: metallophosphoesterase family protein [Planctomycetaceae bacterium]
MRVIQTCLLATVTVFGCFDTRAAATDVIVHPYVQNPAQDAMTICWVTQSDSSGELTVSLNTGELLQTITSSPVRKSELGYRAQEAAHLPGGTAPDAPFFHRIRVKGLQSGTTYSYAVRQGRETFFREFHTAPAATDAVRFIVYADSETEPESTGKYADWPAPFEPGKRPYVVDQTEGYRQNLRVIKDRQPHFIAIAGDIVETGGEQRDWDEFWRHNAGEFSDIAGTIAILPAVGNHENYAGSDGGYSVEGARRGLDKYQTYFETPDNGSGRRAFEDRFYRIDYGPLTWITIDSTDGSPDKSETDTNFHLLGEHDGGEAPDFNPGSTQYEWLEKQLADAESKSRFTFVQFHHVPYSVGPHGLPAGSGRGQDTQSGQPVRVLLPLFQKYGVDAVFSGHDEMYEHSIVSGIHFYDIGMGGDGLRKPVSGKDGSSRLPKSNPYQVFLAHLNALEVWNGKQLVSGGKHYGHMEVNISKESDGTWKAELTPVHIFPLMDSAGIVTGWERRSYDDEVVLRR